MILHIHIYTLFYIVFDIASNRTSELILLSLLTFSAKMCLVHICDEAGAIHIILYSI